MGGIDSRLRRRELFDQDADGYHASRPGYPPRVYELLEAAGALGPGARVLEIGAGSGDATGELLARRANVVAVELGANFTAHLRARLGHLPLTVIEGDFDSVTGLEPGFDLVACAASLHWLNTATALPKIAGLLRPGGWLAAWWTVYGDPSKPAPFRAALNRVLHQHRPTGRLGTLEPLNQHAWVAELSVTGAFDDIRAENIQWSAVMSTDRLVRLYATFAAVRELPGDRRAALLRDIAETADALGGEVTEHYITAVYLARRRGAEHA
jgi:SAM-dependent methyltransferase